jgi:hypothetical protein
MLLILASFLVGPLNTIVTMLVTGVLYKLVKELTVTEKLYSVLYINPIFAL